MTEVSKGVKLAGVDMGHVHWTSPEIVNAAVRKVARGKVALDPCSNLASKTGALVEWFGTSAFHRNDAVKAYEKLCKKLKRETSPDEALGLADVAERDLVSGVAAACAQGRNASAKDGLVESWSGMVNLVYVNSPYGAQELPKWMEKCFGESRASTEIIQLLPARTDTKRFHEAMRGAADAICFWGPGRIDFDNPPPGSDGGAPSIASAFLYYGRHGYEFADAFAPHGKVFQISGRAVARRV
jgi:hypothetical protein